MRIEEKVKMIEFLNRLRDFASKCDDIHKTQRDTTMPKEEVRCPPGESYLLSDIIIWYR